MEPTSATTVLTAGVLVADFNGDGKTLLERVAAGEAVVTAVPPNPSAAELRSSVEVGVMRRELPALSKSVSATVALLMPVPALATFMTTSVGLRGALVTPPMIMMLIGPVAL